MYYHVCWCGILNDKSAPPRKCLALGNHHYKHWNDLAGCEANADRLAELLPSSCGFCSSKGGFAHSGVIMSNATVSELVPVL